MATLEIEELAMKQNANHKRDDRIDVNVRSIKMTFWDMVGFMFKWAFASLFVLFLVCLITSPVWLLGLWVIGLIG